MFVNDFEEYQAAMSQINLNESSLPVYKGRIVESCSTYNKVRCILDCPEMIKAHKFCYNLDFDDLCTEDIEKVNKLYECGKNRGYITEEVPEDDEITDTNPVEEKKEEALPDAGDDAGAKEGDKKEEKPEDKPADTPADKPEDKPEDKPADVKKEDKPADKPEEKKEETPEDKPADEKEADKPADEKDEGEKKSLSAEEKTTLKDQYTKLFKSVMLKNKFEKPFTELTVAEKAAVYGELAEKWTDVGTTEFMTKSEENKLENEIIKP